MEISASTQAAPTQAAARPSVRESQPTGRLAALKALQRALETEQDETAMHLRADDGKGRIVDLRC